MLKLVNINKTYKSNKVLKNINLEFNNKELVFILGASGSGKSTLLNIIGLLDKPTSGLLYKDNICISKHLKKDIDNYHLNDISFIFQNYNLIEYMTVIDNIKLCLNNIDNNKIDKILTKLNIISKRNELVSNLSGGEKQRVAIARAIIKDSSIILCDEPTGALDSSNSINVMNILYELSKEKLVIVVTHNIELTKRYNARIIKLNDGITRYKSLSNLEKFKEKTSNKIKNLYKISIKNLLLNKKRTILTSIASSIGIFCLLLVLGLSIGFKKEVSSIEKDLVSVFPLTIYNDTNIDTIKNIEYKVEEYDIYIPLVSSSNKLIDLSYIDYIPSSNYIYNNYNIIKGRNILNNKEILISTSSNKEVLEYFNVDNYEDLIGKNIKVISNDNYYNCTNTVCYELLDKESMYNNSNFILTIVGIVEEKEVINDNSLILLDNTVLKDIFNLNKDSIVIDKLLNNKELSLNNSLTNSESLILLGYNPHPSTIKLYVNSIQNKEYVIKELEERGIEYTDNVKEVIDVIKNFTDIITVILIIFSSISLFVSSSMISILTSIRVLERTKEIGILRSLGASNKNVSRIFNIENIIISILSSIISIVSIIIVSIPLNKILYNYLEVTNLYKLDIRLFILIIIFNIAISYVSGYLPSRKVNKLEITECIKNNVSVKNFRIN